MTPNQIISTDDSTNIIAEMLKNSGSDLSKINYADLIERASQSMQTYEVSDKITHTRNVSNLVLEQIKQSVMIGDYIDIYQHLVDDVKALQTEIKEISDSIQEATDSGDFIGLTYLHKLIDGKRRQLNDSRTKYIALSNQAGLDLTLGRQTEPKVDPKQGNFNFVKNIFNQDEQEKKTTANRKGKTIDSKIIEAEVETDTDDFFD
jgi:hypothetical protein